MLHKCWAWQNGTGTSIVPHNPTCLNPLKWLPWSRCRDRIKIGWLVYSLWFPVCIMYLSPHHNYFDHDGMFWTTADSSLIGLAQGSGYTAQRIRYDDSDILQTNNQGKVYRWQYICKLSVVSWVHSKVVMPHVKWQRMRFGSKPPVFPFTNMDWLQSHHG